ncbi:hypothetical protein C9I57_04505 [Trinickia symbiotica]|uniref:Uncharacterized protein n=1 Tax=Trinickia symbiotica TaxID=863227 RepID=A0A2T3XZE7_9BURK|nr:hypothetical protein C9I57_04505 [Trinickia symbiotica]
MRGAELTHCQAGLAFEAYSARLDGYSLERYGAVSFARTHAIFCIAALAGYMTIQTGWAFAV